MRVSVAITNYNRQHLVIKAFEQILSDQRVDEVIISDDCSTLSNYNWLVENTSRLPKVLVYRNEDNLGMSRNKARAVELCSNQTVILFDSDNILTPSYLDALEKNQPMQMPDVIYCPEYAEPNFDYTMYAGKTFSSNNAKHHIEEKEFNVLLNTCNYVVNKDRYLAVYKHDETIMESDTIYFNYLWLKSGGKLKVVEGMRYFHLVHNESGWLSHAGYNIRKATELKELIKNL